MPLTSNVTAHMIYSTQTFAGQESTAHDVSKSFPHLKEGGKNGVYKSSESRPPKLFEGHLRILYHF